MSKSVYLNKMFQIILKGMIDTGKAPDYNQVAAELGISPPEGRKLLRKMVSGFSFPGWFQPKTDDIASFAPFNNVPTNYKVTIDGEQKWFAQ